MTSPSATKMRRIVLWLSEMGIRLIMLILINHFSIRRKLYPCIHRKHCPVQLNS